MSDHQENNFVPCHEENLAQISDVSNNDDINFEVEYSRSLGSSDEKEGSGNAEDVGKRDSSAEFKPSLLVNAVKTKPEDETNVSEPPVELVVKSEPETNSNFPNAGDGDDEKRNQLPQAVSIQWLNLDKVPNADTLEDRIQMIIDKYNEKINERKTADNKGPPAYYKEAEDAEVDNKETETDDEETPDNNIYDQYDAPKLDTKDYKVKKYGALHSTTTIMSQRVLPKGKAQKTQNYSFIFFFYKENPERVISATTYAGWQVINPYVDYTFSKKVITEVGNSDQIKEIVKLCLFGECAKKTLKYPEKLTLCSTSCLYDLISSVTCAIKPTSSLGNLLRQITSDRSHPPKEPKPGSASSKRKPLKLALSPNPQKQSKLGSSILASEQPKPGSLDSTQTPPKLRKVPFYITMTNGGVRIQKNIELIDYPRIIDLYNDYMMGNIVQDNERKDDGFAFLRFFQHRHLIRKELDESFMEEIFQKCKEKKKTSVRVIYHKNLDDFLLCEKIEIGILITGNSSKKKKYEYEALEIPLNIEEIFEKIMNKIQKKDDEIEFKTCMANATLRFTYQDSETCKPIPLLECIEGELRHTDDNSYFKIRNMWYTINADHLALLQQDFIRIFENALIPRWKDEKESELSEGWLTKIWKSRPKILTVKLLQDRLNSKELGNEIIENLLQCRVFYVHEGIVKQNELVGEILKNKNIILKNKDSIEEILRESETFSEDKIKQKFKNRKIANKILKELKKERHVIIEKENEEEENEEKENEKKGKKKKNDKYVLNPFPYPLKHILQEKYDTMTQLLVELYVNSAERRQEESDYNSAYLKEPYGINEKYLVFDNILPDNIEPCDILKYTDEKIYLYHVKKNLSQDTREACSQILNAATIIRHALSIHHSDNYLKKLWTKAQKTYKNKNKKPFLEEKEFMDIFRNRNLVFVYAYCPKPSHNYSRGVRNALNVVKDSETMDRLINMLKVKNYLDKREKLTHHFVSEKEKDFKLEGEFKKLGGKVFKQLRSYYNFCDSTIAKMEIVRLANKVRALGYEFKIVEIEEE